MLNPIQRLLLCSRQGQKSLNTLLVASGPSLYAFGATDGKVLSKWSHQSDTKNELPTETLQHVELSEGPGSQGPPGKRRKLSPPLSNDPSGHTSPEIVIDNGSKMHARRKPKSQVANVPAIIELCSTSDGRHIIAVTGEDKCIRVLTLSEDGTFEQISQRAMPKRPNALTLTPDQRTILCGDKFGDVYALPLIEDPSFNPPIVMGPEAGVKGEEQAAKPFVPSASSSTVHTKRNLSVLRMQQKQAAVKAQAQKQGPQFEHKLLLGHVSLLTDVVSIQITSSHGRRNYILTSDRDEHIRVSRGIPQAHIIENYCLGHSQFISRICNPWWRPDLLVSGGGDNYLISWDWMSGTANQQVDIKVHVEAVRSTLNSGIKPDESLGETGVTVSGIWALRTGNLNGQIIVACEGLPALLTYNITSRGELEHQETLITNHNILDVLVDQAGQRMIYSLDNLHRPLSTTEIEAERRGPIIGVHRFSTETSGWLNECDGTLSKALNAWAKVYEPPSQQGDADQLSQLFYGIGNLRKRGTEDQDQEK